MTYSDNLIYYYLVGKQKMVNLYNYVIIKFIGFTDMRVISNNQQYNVIFRYFLFMCMTRLINMIYFMRNKIDIKAEKLHLTKITEKGEKTIILENSDITLNDVSNILQNVQPDENMLNCVFLTFELVNPNDNTICLKNLIVKYKESEEDYCHTLQNIFAFNDIKHFDDSIINVKMAKNRKIMSFNIPLKDVNDKHINHFINLEK